MNPHKTKKSPAKTLSPVFTDDTEKLKKEKWQWIMVAFRTTIEKCEIA